MNPIHRENRAGGPPTLSEFFSWSVWFTWPSLLSLNIGRQFSRCMGFIRAVRKKPRLFYTFYSGKRNREEALMNRRSWASTRSRCVE